MKDAAKRTSIGSKRNPASAEAILDAAEQVILEGGLQAFSIEAVARRAKAGKPTIYRWWSTRGELLLEVYKRQKDLPFPDTGDVRLDLLKFAHGLNDFWKRDAGAVFRSIIAQAQSEEGTAKALAEYKRERHEEGGIMIKRAQERGEVSKATNPDAVIDIISSIVWTRLLTDTLDAPKAEIDSVVETVLNGIRA